MISLIYEMLKPIKNSFQSSELREFYRIRDKYLNIKRFSKFSANIFNRYNLEVIDSNSFIHQFKEIFVDGIYEFKTAKQSPIVFDCGANIGLSVLYFKEKYPTAKIFAFEADPQIVTVLRANLEHNSAGDVHILGQAVWVDDKGIDFGVQGADAGSIYKSSNKIKIPSIRLNDLLVMEEQIDFLKLDIEGAEYEVLADCHENLARIENIFIEYHSWGHTSQTLGEILNLLQENGFRYNIDNVSRINSPYLQEIKGDKEIEFKLNIYARNLHV